MLLKYIEELVETSKMTLVCVDTSGLDEGGLVIVYFVYSGKPRGWTVTHKYRRYPERCSAFTFWENDIPSHLDLLKQIKVLRTFYI